MEEQQHFFTISPQVLFPDQSRDFEIYTRRGDRFFLYCGRNEPFTQTHRDILRESAGGKVYIQAPDADWFRHYAQQRLGSVLMDESLPLPERARAFYDTSLDVARQVFTSKLPDGLPRDLVNRVAELVNLCLNFLTTPDGLKSIGGLMTHDYDTYGHSINVFVLSATLLMSTGCYRQDELLDYGIGAMLHDIGKTTIPRRILNKPGKLNKAEMDRVRLHPREGHLLCLSAGLSQYAHDMILYHHEQLDGKGYPEGLRGSAIPSHVRAVTIVDIYDALTSRRPYAPPLAPFDALSLMRREFQGKIDPDLFEKLVRILGGML